MTTPNKDRAAFEAYFSNYPPHFYELNEKGDYIVWDMKNRFIAYQAASADRDLVIAALQGVIDSMAQTNAALIKKLQATKAQGA